MKNNKILIIGAVIFIIIIVVGYALFSENISITGTAKAEGQLNLAITNPQVSGQITMEKNPSDYLEYKIEGTKINLTATLTAPNDNVQFLANIENKGSVDAKLNNISATPNFNRDDACNLSSSIGDEECGLFKNSVYYDNDTGLYFLVGIININTFELNSNNIIIPSGDSSGNYQLTVMVGWDQNWKTAVAEPQKITFTVDFGFIQDK